MEQKIPHFKYHPDPIKTGTFETDKTVRCNGCGKKTGVYYNFYSNRKKKNVCPDCLHNGKAQSISDGDLNGIRYREECEGVIDKRNIEELTCRTPGFIFMQDDFWLEHCNDFCAFIDYVSWHDLEQMGVANEIIAYMGEVKYTESEINNVINSGGSVERYLFRCLHCGKYLLHYDYD